MRYAKYVYPLLAWLLTSIAFAQTSHSQPTTAAESDQIASARSAYAQSNPTVDSGDNNGATLAQDYRREGTPPFPTHRRYVGRETYEQPRWSEHGSAAHALIGAAIGFGIGAALGASSSASNHTSVAHGVFLSGSIFGLIGAAIGAGSSSHGHGYLARRRRPYPRRQLEDGDADDSAHSADNDATAEQREFSDSASLTTQGIGAPAKATSSPRPDVP
jgi:hypothetical protein